MDAMHKHEFPSTDVRHACAGSQVHVAEWQNSNLYEFLHAMLGLIYPLYEDCSIALPS